MSAQLESMPTDWERALAIVAHPDDLEYGAAGAIAQWTDAGKEVAYLLVSRGEAGIDGIPPEEAVPLREREQRASAAIVGVSSVDFLDHPDGVIEYGVRLRADLAAAIRDHRPELVITLNHRDTFGPSIWNTPDHKAVGRAVLDACGDAGNRWIFPDQLGAERQPWGGVRWVAVAGSPQPTHAVELGAGRERAVRSLLAHRAYIEGLTDEDPETYCRRFVEWSTGLGSERFGGRPAVAFELFPR